MGRARQGANGRHAPPGGVRRRALPAMRASVRRRDVAHTADALQPRRKGKRSRRANALGGRLAASVRTARLRARRAAEEFGLRR
jgi:hypothetical protein